ncbi:MAG: sodium:proton antiporter [Verrucomicrobia bacterium]|nr:sodium:proton antiporter [Verrucomicrobiota bacterium]
MKRIILFSVLLLLGLVSSQMLVFLDEEIRRSLVFVIRNINLVFLAFIMIHVGAEFSIDRSNMGKYGWDYFVAATAAGLPWIFCTLYFVYAFNHGSEVPRFAIWTDALLLARFASPTATGVLFAMFTAAGLENTWVFKKARTLIIFDDLDTILFLIPIKMFIVGFHAESVVMILLISTLLYLIWKKSHVFRLPLNWYWVLLYAFLIAGICETIFIVTDHIEAILPIQIEILLPAFALGTILAYPKRIRNIHHFFEKGGEKIAKWFITGLFIFLVGFSMPPIKIEGAHSIGGITVPMALLHVLALTFLSNLGKMFPFFCYRKEATMRERFALALTMCPRGEVGAGVLILAIGLLTHIDKVVVLLAMTSLALNLLLTGPLIMVIKQLLSKVPEKR